MNNIIDENQEYKKRRQRPIIKIHFQPLFWNLFFFHSLFYLTIKNNRLLNVFVED